MFYVAVFATYPSKVSSVNDKILLGLSTIENEDSLDETQRYKFMEYVLGIHRKHLEMSSWSNTATKAKIRHSLDALENIL